MHTRSSLRILFKDTRFIDGLNIGLIVLSCVLSHFFPYQMLLGSYAILGPAHYLTQISWLHDRAYFARSRGILLIFSAMTLLSIISVIAVPDHTSLLVTILIVALCSALAFTVTPRFEIGVASMIGGIFLSLLIVKYISAVALFILILLPTVLHIFVFTAGFMWAGALRSKQPTAYAAVFVMIIAGLSFLSPGTLDKPPSLTGVSFFQPAVDYMHRYIPGTVETRLFGFLGFAYTYHYLNWFSKADIIHWNRIPPRRLEAIVIIYASVEMAYFINYAIGYLIVLFLSILHVMLEFPLNFRTFAAIGGAAIKKIRPAN